MGETLSTLVGAETATDAAAGAPAAAAPALAPAPVLDAVSAAHKAASAVKASARYGSRQSIDAALLRKLEKREALPAAAALGAGRVALLQCNDHALANKFCRIANDAAVSARALPGLAHGGAACAARRVSEKQTGSHGKGVRRPAWLALVDADPAAVGRALRASPEGLLGARLVHRVLAGDVRVDADGDLVGAALAALEVARGGDPGPARVAVRGTPRALERAVIARLPAGVTADPRDFSLAIHVADVEDLGRFAGVVKRADEWSPSAPESKDADAADANMRAAWKLREVIGFGLDGGALVKAGYAVDVGAAPGGWTACLAAAGARVAAVDPADLDPAIAALPNVTHARCKIEDWTLDEAPRALVCDANVHPAQLAEMVGPIVAKLPPGAPIVLTLKFGGRGHGADAELRKRTFAAEVFRDLDALAPMDPDTLRLEWLVANTDRERTFVARRRSS